MKDHRINQRRCVQCGAKGAALRKQCPGLNTGLLPQNVKRLALAVLICLLPVVSYAQTQTQTNNLQWVASPVNPNGDNAPDIYKVERKIGAGAYSQINTTPASIVTYSDVITGDTGGIVYCYRVRASNSVGDSGYSNEACATSAIIKKAPNAPSGLKTAGVSSNQIALQWQNNAPDAEGQKVHIAATQGPGSGRREWIALDRLASSYTDRAVTRNTTYQYQVEAFNAAGGSFSNAVTTKTPR